MKQTLRKLLNNKKKSKKQTKSITNYKKQTTLNPIFKKIQKKIV